MPVSVTASNPTSDVTVFQLRYSCYESYYYGTYCQDTYEVNYDAPGSFCQFRTDDPTLSAIDGQRVRCTV